MFDVPLMITAVLVFGGQFGARTVVAALFTPGFMNILTRLVYSDAAFTADGINLDPALLLGGSLNLSNDLLLTCIIGAVVIGVGQGMVVRTQATTGIYPPVVLLCFAVWVVILMMTHYVSLASIVAGCCFPVFTIASPKVNQSVPFIVFSFVTAVLLLYTHRKNIVRLKNGTESKIYIWKPHRKADK